ncbi:MAG: c-type cytochrome, partial [Vicinamibacterales bacterium]
MMHLPTRHGLLSATIGGGAIGALVLGVTLYEHERAQASATTVPAVATEEYGRRLLTDTAALLGPDHENPDMRYSGIRLSCESCHLGAGADPGMLSLLESADLYPRYSGRDGGERDLVDRINGCMERSMNGRALPRDSAEMMAMVAYVESLGDRFGAMGANQRTASNQPQFVRPDRAADVGAGEQVFTKRCVICHGANGEGLRTSADPADGYVFPPLWGPDSFNDGAGMHRVLTASRFIKARMPLGEATLTDEEAFDVAAYINAQPRPAMDDLVRDYPKRADKPIDSPYGPYADPFPQEQHKFGPFKPIEEYYRAQKA